MRSLLRRCDKRCMIGEMRFLLRRNDELNGENINMYSFLIDEIPAFAGMRGYPMCARFNRNAFAITETELKLIASAAIIGESRIPKKGNNTPAATGTPKVL